MYEAGEVDGSSIVACCETPAVLEAIEAPLDPISLLIEFGVMRDCDLAISLCRDDRLRIHLGDAISQIIAIRCFVGEHGISAPIFEK